MRQNLIPTIDISSIVNEGLNSDKSIKTINKIKKACQNIGFFQVVKHGISKKNIKNICNVGNKFFNSPDKNKRKRSFNNYERKFFTTHTNYK